MKPDERKPGEPLAVRPKDELFVSINGRVQSGSVICHGKHGATVRVGGADHQVPWHGVHGFKRRAPVKMKLVDHGDDGAVVDEGGKRRFIAGLYPPGYKVPDAPDEPLAPEKPMAKAFGLALIFPSEFPDLLKAIKNGPGLSLRDVTDKAGHQTKRWMKNTKDMPKARSSGSGDDAPSAARGYGTHNLGRGDRVSFRIDGKDQAGDIVSTGKDGAKVRDGGGATHDVIWSRITGHKRPAVPTAGAKKKETPPNRQQLAANPAKPIPADRFDAADFATAHDEPDVTPESILAKFPADTAGKIRQTQERLTSIENTIDKFRADGRYEAERKKRHADIITNGLTATVMDEDTGEMVEKFFPGILSGEAIEAATPPDGQAPTFTMLGGRGGSGKSKLKDVVYDPAKTILLDSDHIKKLLPEYEGWNAAQVHDEAGDIFDAITDRAEELGLNLVHDATMKTPAKAVALIKRFKDAGYRTEAHYMHLPRQVAAERAVHRFLGVTGRYVPVEVILDNTKNEAAFDQVKGMVDAWSFRDNNVPRNTPPILISESRGSQEA